MLSFSFVEQTVKLFCSLRSWEVFEAESVCWEAAGGQCGHHLARARQNLVRDAGFFGLRHYVSEVPASLIVHKCEVESLSDVVSQLQLRILLEADHVAITVSLFVPYYLLAEALLHIIEANLGLLAHHPLHIEGVPCRLRVLLLEFEMLRKLHQLVTKFLL